MSQHSTHPAYDDDELVEDIARDQLPVVGIAAKHGISDSMVRFIACGERRPDLQPRIKAAIEGLVDEARRKCAKHAGPAADRLGAIVADSEADDDTQRKAAVDILKFAVGDPSKPETNINNQGPPAHYDEFLAWRAKNREGPE